MFDSHYCISNFIEPSKNKCSGMTSDFMTSLTEARDNEMYGVMNDMRRETESLAFYKHFILLVLRCHIEGENIINYFSWQKLHSHSNKKRPLRLSSVVPLSKKTKITVDAVLGKNEEELRENSKTKTNPEVDENRRKKEIKNWETFWDDMIFLSKLNGIRYYEVDSPHFKSIEPRIYNRKVISKHEKYYWMGFPDKSGKN